MSKVYISEMADHRLKQYLKNKGFELVYVNCNNVYPAIRQHPDIIMCQLGDSIYHGNPEKPGNTYPGDIIYNCACTGKFFIHNLKYTDPELKKLAEKKGMITVNVPQGYTKCNVVVVSEDAIITSDRGIFRACSPLMKVLLTEPGQVLLPGMNCGFLGGASGKCHDEIIFNGDLSKHSDFEKIVKFITDENMKPVWFSGYPLTDIGSVIFAENE